MEMDTAPTQGGNRPSVEVVSTTSFTGAFANDASAEEIREVVTIRGIAHFKDLKANLEVKGFVEAIENGSETVSVLSDGTGKVILSVLQQDRYRLEIVAPSEVLNNVLSQLPRSAILERSSRRNSR